MPAWLSFWALIKKNTFELKQMRFSAYTPTSAEIEIQIVQFSLIQTHSNSGMFSLAGQVHGAANAKLGSFSRKNSWKLVNVVTLSPKLSF